MNDFAKPSLGLSDFASLYELATTLLQLDDFDAMLDAVVQHALGMLGADRGFLVLRREQNERLEFKVVRNWRLEELEGAGESVSRSIVTEVLRHGEPMLVEDVLGDLRFAAHRSVLEIGVRSVLAAPLVEDGRTVGALYLESHSAARLFGPEDLDLFKRVLALASKALQASTRRLVLEQRARLADETLLARYNFTGILTRDPGLLDVLKTVGQVAASEMPVLVQGPSGSGKELIARALHLNSPRSRDPFVTINCGAISPHLLESELFGHVKGAFTGAIADKLGQIPRADGGVVFLDEVGELPKELQVKLLRTLQFGEVLPVGAVQPLRVDARFVAATNLDLEREVQNGRFREDLLYRLNAITIQLPALRERPDDILPLFHHFLAQGTMKAGRPAPKVSVELERVLLQYPWPGNVRELENEAGRLLALAPDGETLSVQRLSKRIARAVLAEQESLGTLEQREQELILLHLRAAGGNRSLAAKTLGISREGLRKKMKRFGLSAGGSAPDLRAGSETGPA